MPNPRPTDADKPSREVLKEKLRLAKLRLTMEHTARDVRNQVIAGFADKKPMASTVLDDFFKLNGYS